MLGFIQKFLDPSSNNNSMIGFEDVKIAIRQGSQSYLLINTLSIMEQQCLISGTLAYDREEIVINKIIEETTNLPNIIIYGKHSVDESPQIKQRQLKSLGFKRVYIYSGGLFEWLLLQDIYGTAEFPTTGTCKDLLAFRPAPSLMTRPAITY